MLRHGCACGDAHAEHAGRLEEVWSRLKQVGLTETCEIIESRKATMEELQLAHTQEHTLRYGATTLARKQSGNFRYLDCPSLIQTVRIMLSHAVKVNTLLLAKT